ncbi:MAG TPA: sulfotransferase [Blastocatellia bacterium]|nr:sulfotransferase [Blastocatellia bacterium]
MTSQPTNGSASPVFILSSPRSGSTLLRYIVDTHPSICCPGELHLGELIQSLHTAFYFTTGQVTAFANEEEREQRVFSEIRQVISNLMEAYAAAKNKPIWCEKSPANLRFVELLHAVFPEGKYICMHRNCMDVVYSLIEGSRLGFMTGLVDYVRASPGNLINAMAQSWVDRTKKLLNFEREHASNCFRIKYESVISDTTETLNQLFAFLDLEWDEKLQDTVFSTPHDFGPGDIKAALARKINTESVGKGSTLDLIYLPDEILDQINQLLEELQYPVLVREEDRVSLSTETDPLPTEGQATQQIQELFLNQFAQRLNERKNYLQDTSAALKFIVGSDGGTWLINLNNEAVEIKSENGEAQCVISVDAPDLIAMADGKLNAGEAFLSGRLQVRGDLLLARQVATVLFGG